jgi:uncharacterized protein
MSLPPKRGLEIGSMIESHADGLLLQVHVKPKSSRNGLIGIHGDRLKIAVTSAPDKGKANAAVLELLSKQLGLKRSQVTLVAGETVPLKTVLVRAVDQDALRQRIASALAAASRPGPVR